jgi:hypothetical protein
VYSPGWGAFRTDFEQQLTTHAGELQVYQMSFDTIGATLDDRDGVTLEVLWIPVIELRIILERRIPRSLYIVPHVLKGADSPSYYLFSIDRREYQSDNVVDVMLVLICLMICHQEKIRASHMSDAVVDVASVKPLILYVRVVTRMGGENSGDPPRDRP